MRGHNANISEVKNPLNLIDSTTTAFVASLMTDRQYQTMAVPLAEKPVRVIGHFKDQKSADAARTQLNPLWEN